MKKHKRLTLVIISIIAIGIGTGGQLSADRGEVLLEYKLKEEEQFSEKINMAFKIAGVGMPGEAQFTILCPTTYVVSGISEDELIEMHLVYSPKVTEAISGGRNAPEELQQLLNPLEVARIKMRKDGHIVESTEKLFVDIGPLGFKKYFSPIGILPSNSSHPGGMSRRDPVGTGQTKPVKLGDIWEQTVENPDIGKLEIKFSLASFETVHDYDCARLEGEITGALYGPENADMRIKEGKYTAYFAIEEGLLITEETVLNMDVDVPTGEKVNFQTNYTVEFAGKETLKPEQLKEKISQLSLIEKGHDALSKGDYTAAKGTFQKFLTDYPQSPWRDGVQGLLAKAAPRPRQQIVEPRGETKPTISLAPSITMQDITGKTINLLELQNKLVFVNFWATWCPGCLEEMPALNSLYEAHKENLVVLGISVDKDGEDAVKAYIEKRKITYPIIMSTREILDAFESAVGEPIDTIPTTIVIGKGGFILKKYVGAQKKEEFSRTYESAGVLPKPEETLPQPKGTGAIKGRVSDVSPDRKPVSDARVMYVGLGIKGEVKTDESGQYKITGLPPGQYVISVRKEGYAPRDEIPATVISGSETVLEIKLRSDTR